MDMKTLLEDSFRQAKTEVVSGDTIPDVNRSRSQAWLKALAKSFSQAYEPDSEIRVFSKYDPTHRPDFGLNEYLHDILVCRVDSVPSARHRKRLFYIKTALWQVESEFAPDSRQALVDFNKLVLGSAKYKLFIGPQVDDPEGFLKVFLSPAEACIGTVYVALLPHPQDWGKKSDHADVWKLSGKQWLPVNDSIPT